MKKDKIPYTESNTYTHELSGQCEHRAFADGDVPYPLGMHHGKDCVEKFIEHTQDEVKRLYAMFSNYQFPNYRLLIGWKIL